MAKLKETANIKLVNTTDNSVVEYATTTEPKKSTWGNSYFGTLNSKGIAKLQAKGFSVKSEDEWCDLLKATFGLTEQELGDRGAKWDTPEARATLKVFINEVEYNPEFSKAQKARHEAEAVVYSVPKAPVAQSNTASAIPTPIPTPQPVANVPVPPAPVASIPLPPVQAVADTVQVAIPMPPQPVVEAPVLTPLEAGYVNLIKDYITKGTATKDQIIASLGSKVGEAKAKELYGLAE